jgi:hypothetical protein
MKSLIIALALSAAMCAPFVNAEQPDLKTLLVGKWRQPSGKVTGETWEIRAGNQLWLHNLNWSPKENHGMKIAVPEWDGTEIRVIDNDHIVDKTGYTATRVRLGP